MQFGGNFLGNLLDAPCRFHVELLRRELYRGIAGVNAGKLDVFRYGVGDDFAVARHGIHFHLLSVLQEAAHHYGVLLRHVGCELQEAFQFFLVGAYVHRCAGKHVTGADEYGEAHAADKLVDIFHRSECAPLGLVHADASEHRGELFAVLGIVDVAGLCAE